LAEEAAEAFAAGKGRGNISDFVLKRNDGKHFSGYERRPVEKKGNAKGEGYKRDEEGGSEKLAESLGHDCEEDTPGVRDCEERGAGAENRN
jgi:hypothetical protein